MAFFTKEKIGNKRILHVLGIKISYKKKSQNQQKIDELKLKQDLTSQVEFYLIDAFEIFHFLPIYNELLKQGIKARIVAEPCEINTAKTWFDYNEALKILKENNVDYCTKCNPSAKIAFTTQKAQLLSKYKNKKVNISYGFGFTKDYFINSKDSTKGFDIKFVHGKLPKEIVESYNLQTKIEIFGYPKYNQFLQNKPSKETLIKELNICTQKPILVYFPTWDEETSITKFSDEIMKLKQEFFIISKPHHCTFRLKEKRNDLDTLYKISDLVLDGNYDFAKATLLGDIALCDIKSGASCEVKYLNNNIPVILLSPNNNLDKYLSVATNYFDIVTDVKSLNSEIKNIMQDKDYIKKTDLLIRDIYSNTDLKKISNIIAKEL